MNKIHQSTNQPDGCSWERLGYLMGAAGRDWGTCGFRVGPLISDGCNWKGLGDMLGVGWYHGVGLWSVCVVCLMECVCHMSCGQLSPVGYIYSSTIHQ